jgi:hypothetical protein
MIAEGRLTRGELRSSAWQRLFRDVYACADVPVTHQVRAVAAARLLLPEAVVTGRSAAVLWGIPAAGRDDDVELTLPPGSAACTMPGLHVRRRHLDAEHLTSRRGARATTPTATAFDLARIQPLDEAVVALDQFLAPGLVLLDELRAAANALTGYGCRQVRAAVGLADGRAESPQETRLRLLLHRSPLPLPTAQFSVRVDGRFVARVDFAWPELEVAVEYEGLWHGERQHVARDRQRLNRLTAAGWRVIFVTAADLHHPAALIARIATALGL